MKSDNRTKGIVGEKAAEKYLRSEGYDIVSKNFKTEVGEIDIVAVTDDVLVFVEVKTRSNDVFGLAAEAVDYRKQQKICCVAAQYIKKFRLYDTAVRFDVIEVYLDSGEINHVEGAFGECFNY